MHTVEHQLPPRAPPPPPRDFNPLGTLRPVPTPLLYAIDPGAASGNVGRPGTDQVVPPGSSFYDPPPPVPPGYQRPGAASGGGGSDDLFTKLILGIVGAGIGGAGGAVVGATIANTLAGALAGQSIDYGTVLNFLGGAVTDYTRGAGPSLPNIAIETIRAAQPFDPGGLGGGVLTSGPLLGISGQLTGQLLKGKRIRIEDLLTGQGKSVSALAGILQRTLR